MTTDKILRWCFGFFLVIVVALLTRGVARNHLDAVQAELIGILVGCFVTTMANWSAETFKSRKKKKKKKKAKLDPEPSPPQENEA